MSASRESRTSSGQFIVVKGAQDRLRPDHQNIGVLGVLALLALLAYWRPGRSGTRREEYEPVPDVSCNPSGNALLAVDTLDRPNLLRVEHTGERSARTQGHPLVGRVEHRLNQRRQTLIDQQLPFTDITTIMHGAGIDVALQVSPRNTKHSFGIIDQLRHDSRVQSQRLLMTIRVTIMIRGQHGGDGTLRDPPMRTDQDIPKLALRAEINDVLTRHS